MAKYLYSPDAEVAKRKAVFCENEEQEAHWRALGWHDSQCGPLPSTDSEHPKTDREFKPAVDRIAEEGKRVEAEMLPEVEPSNVPLPEPKKRGPGRPRKERDE